MWNEKPNEPTYDSVLVITIVSVSFVLDLFFNKRFKLSFIGILVSLIGIGGIFYTNRSLIKGIFVGMKQNNYFYEGDK